MFFFVLFFFLHTTNYYHLLLKRNPIVLLCWQLQLPLHNPFLLLSQIYFYKCPCSYPFFRISFLSLSLCFFYFSHSVWDIPRMHNIYDFTLLNGWIWCPSSCHVKEAKNNVEMRVQLHLHRMHILASQSSGRIVAIN